MTDIEPKKPKRIYVKVPLDFDTFDESQIDEFAEVMWNCFVNANEAEGCVE